MGYSRKRIFITGLAGFIGFHLALYLHKQGDFVVGCDNFNAYYDPELKKERAAILSKKGIELFHCDICDQRLLEELIEKNQITHLIHLAAQAGVRYSITHPAQYQQANSNGFFHVLEVLRKFPHIKFVFASSSSVYGRNKKIPFSESDQTDLAANFYGATKKSNEVMASAYSHLYGISTIALRFFTVYGPWGRPDMAYFSFTKAIEEDKPIKLFNHGKMKRDFTYIDDVVNGIATALDFETKFEIFNLGNNHPEELMKMIKLIEDFTKKKARLEMLPMPSGEIQTTFADIAKAEKFLGFSPQTSLEKGMEKFFNWYKELTKKTLV